MLEYSSKFCEYNPVDDKTNAMSLVYAQDFFAATFQYFTKWWSVKCRVDDWFLALHASTAK